MKYDPTDFFNYGKSAFHSSQLLFKTPYNYGFTILFVHGLELILKSFIILQTGHKPPTEHDIVKLFKTCRKLGADDVFTKDAGLEDLLDFFSKKFYIDTVTARYPDMHKSRINFPHNSFRIVEEAIIAPLEIKINNTSS